MKKVDPYPEVTEKLPPVKWESEAIETLQSLERYTVLKAVEEGKRLVKRVMETAIKNADNQVVTKLHIHNAIAGIMDNLELFKNQQVSRATSAT